MRLMLIAIAMGMCLTNGYAVFKVQTHPPKEKQVEEINPFTCLLSYWSKVSQKTNFLEKISQPFDCNIDTEFYRPFGASLHLGDLLKGASAKVILHNPSALNIGKRCNSGM